MIVRISAATSMVVVLSILFVGFAADLCGVDIATVAGTGKGGNNGDHGNALTCMLLNRLVWKLVPTVHCM
jgi:hypothetical protein